MANILLVHGAWHGAWCWDRLIPYLERDCHDVRAIDLPGHGTGKHVPFTITLSKYVKAVCDVIDKAETPVTLVGHSMGGCVVAQAAEYLPEKIRNVVFIAGCVPQDKKSMLDIKLRNGFSVPLRDLKYDILNGVSHFYPERAIEYFYDDCAAEDAEHAIGRLIPQPLMPFFNVLSISQNGFGQVPKYYIICSNDKAIPADAQMDMALQSGCDEIVEMNTAHSPFLCAPEELAAHLNRFAGLGGAAKRDLDKDLVTAA